jgi:hypothetical protein
MKKKPIKKQPPTVKAAAKQVKKPMPPVKAAAKPVKSAGAAAKFPKLGYVSAERPRVTMDKINTTVGPRFVVLFPASSKDFKTEAGARRHMADRGVTDLRPRTNGDLQKSIAENNGVDTSSRNWRAHERELGLGPPRPPKR